MTTPAAHNVDDRFPRLFWRLDDTVWEAFSRYGREHRVKAGETVIREGEPSISFFLVRDGEVAITNRGVEIARIGKNHSFGEMGLLLDLPRGGTATAAVPSRVLEISRADLQAMQEKEPLWSSRLYRVMAECLAEYLRNVAQAQAKRRV